MCVGECALKTGAKGEFSTTLEKHLKGSPVFKWASSSFAQQATLTEGRSESII